MADLVETQHNVPCRVEAGDVCALVRIDDKAAFVGHRGTDLSCELGLDDRAKRGIKAVECISVAVDVDNDCLVAKFDRAADANNRHARVAERPTLCVGELMPTIRRHQGDVGGIAAQEQGLVETAFPGAQDGDPLVGDFIAVTDRAIAQTPGGDRVVMDRVGEHRWPPVDDTARDQDRSSRECFGTGGSHKPGVDAIETFDVPLV